MVKNPNWLEEDQLAIFKAQIWLKLKDNNKIAFSGYSFCVQM